MVLAAPKVGSDLPYCLPPNLSPLPVSVHTHSPSLPKSKFSPILFFCFIFILSPINRLLTPLLSLSG